MRPRVKKLPLAFAFLSGMAIALPLAARAQSPAPTPPAATAPAAQAGAPDSPLDPEVTAALQRMGKTLGAERYSFKAKSIRAYAGPNGELLHIEHLIKTTVRRPDRLAIDATGDDVATKLTYDGKTVTVAVPAHKQYATVATTGPISGVIDMLIEKLEVDLPLADLLGDSPSGAFLSDIVSGGQVGTATIDGVVCRHYFFNELPDLDVELWLEDNDKALLRRIYITYRSLPGRPSYIADLWDWDFSTQAPDSEFAFTPAAGMTQVELKPRAKSAPAAAR